MLASKQIFYISSKNSSSKQEKVCYSSCNSSEVCYGCDREGWYFIDPRDGEVHGPFRDSDEAGLALDQILIPFVLKLFEDIS